MPTWTGKDKKLCRKEGKLPGIIWLLGIINLILMFPQAGEQVMCGELGTKGDKDKDKEVVGVKEINKVVGI